MQDGLHRHYKCRKPGTGFGWFDVTTWPGSLCIAGDMGTYVFRRTADMIPFVRSSWKSFSYMAEKCESVDRCTGLKQFYYELVTEWVADELRSIDQSKQENARAVEWLRDMQRSEDNIAEYTPEEIWKGAYLNDVTEEPPTFEWYSFAFLWNLHALGWFCDRHLELAGGV